MLLKEVSVFKEAFQADFPFEGVQSWCVHLRVQTASSWISSSHPSPSIWSHRAGAGGAPCLTSKVGYTQTLGKLPDPGRQGQAQTPCLEEVLGNPEICKWMDKCLCCPEGKVHQEQWWQEESDHPDFWGALRMVFGIRLWNCTDLGATEKGKGGKCREGHA